MKGFITRRQVIVQVEGFTISIGNDKMYKINLPEAQWKSCHSSCGCCIRLRRH